MKGTLWHIVRYTIATAVSTLVSGALPVLFGAAHIVMAVWWILLWAAMLAIQLLPGQVVDPDMELEGGAMGIVLVPVILVVTGIVLMAIAVVLAVAFNLLIVLPVSLLTEFVASRLSWRSALLRLGSFLGAGLVVGSGAAVAVGVSASQAQVHPLALAVAALVPLLTCGCAVFASGLVLTAMSTARDRSAVLP